MKRTITFFLALLFIVPASAQIKVVSFKKIQTFLPAIELQGYQRNKPTGQTQTAMGISTSEASVRYTQTLSDTSTASPIDISIKIQDVSFMPVVLTQFLMMQQNMESETENGYEKWYKYKDKHPGKLSATTSDYKSCKIELAVGNRFLLSASADNTDDIKVLEKMLDSIDMDKLMTLEP